METKVAKSDIIKFFRQVVKENKEVRQYVKNGKTKELKKYAFFKLNDGKL